MQTPARGPHLAGQVQGLRKVCALRVSAQQRALFLGESEVNLRGQAVELEGLRALSPRGTDPRARLLRPVLAI